jgi:protein-S-isoprenylcysteine O-methyltransferase Ste14
MNPTYNQMILSSVLGTLTFAAMVFVPAGTLDYWQGWAYLCTSVVVSGLYTLYVTIHDPALLVRRWKIGPSQEKELAQKVIVGFMLVAFAAALILPLLDYRFDGSSVPWFVSVIGDLLVMLSFYVFYLVSKVNTYAAASVRVEEDQKVIESGVYGLVRHPMYFGALFLIVGTPLALGSWLTLFLIPVFLITLYFRIAGEEQVLIRDLPGYVAYRQKVKRRLVPFVW